MREDMMPTQSSMGDSQETTKLKIFIVYRRWQTGKLEREAAFFSEAAARGFASEMLKNDGVFVGLEIVTVMDSPETTD